MCVSDCTTKLFFWLADRMTFRQLLAAGDKDVIYPILKWVVPQPELLEKRAFVGHYLSFPDVSEAASIQIARAYGQHLNSLVTLACRVGDGCLAQLPCLSTLFLFICAHTVCVHTHTHTHTGTHTDTHACTRADTHARTHIHTRIHLCVSKACMINAARDMPVPRVRTDA